MSMAVKPLLVDLFCGAGGATRGYQLAGFGVLGVDRRPQPRYVGDEFVQADALEWLAAADLTVPGAPLRPDLVLCGEMFGLRVRRHRWFQTSPMLYQLMPPCRHDTSPVGVYGHPGSTSGRDYRRTRGDVSYSIRASLGTWKDAMGIDWMSGAELSQAIPPAYTHHIGTQLIEQLASVAP